MAKSRTEDSPRGKPGRNNHAQPKAGAVPGSRTHDAAAAATRKPRDAQARARRRMTVMMSVSGSVKRSALQPAKVKTGRSKTGSYDTSLTIRMDELAKKMLKGIANETGSTLQALGIEAVNLFLVAHGRKPVA